MKIVELNRARREFIERTEQQGVNDGTPVDDGSSARVRSHDDFKAAKVEKYNQQQEDIRTKTLSTMQESVAESRKQTSALSKQTSVMQQQAMTMTQMQQSLNELVELLSKQKLETIKQGYASNDGEVNVYGEAKQKLIDDLGSMFGDIFGFGRRGRWGGYGRGGRGRGRTRRPRNPRDTIRNRRNKPRNAPTTSKGSRTSVPKTGSMPKAKPQVKGRTARAVDAVRDKISSGTQAVKTTAGAVRDRVASGAQTVKSTASTVADKGTAVAKDVYRYGSGKVSSGWRGAKDLYANTPGRGKAKLLAAVAGGIGLTSLIGGSDEVKIQPSKADTLPEKPEAEVEHPLELKPTIVVDGVERPIQNVVTIDGRNFIPQPATMQNAPLGFSQDRPKGLKPQTIIQTGDTENTIKYGTEMMTAEEIAKFLQSEHGSRFDIKGVAGSAAFVSAYSQVAAKDPSIAEAQQQFLRERAYAPQVTAASAATGVDLGSRGYEVQEMLYATGRRFGGDDTSVTEALRTHKVRNMTDAEILKTVYEYQIAKLGTYFGEDDTATLNAMRKTLADEGSALVTQAMTPTTNVKQLAMAQVRVTNPTGVQVMQSSPQGAINYAVQAMSAASGTVPAHAQQSQSAPGQSDPGFDEGMMNDPAVGELYAEGLKHVVKNHNRVNMEGLHPTFKKYFYTMVGDWVLNHGGTKVYVESAFRTRAQQQRLWDNCKKTPKTRWVARPGTSRHESGFAIDIDRRSAGSLEGKGLMRKYGFHRPLSNEPWHVELIAAKRKESTDIPMPSEAPVKVDDVTAVQTPSAQMPEPVEAELDVQSATPGATQQPSIVNTGDVGSGDVPTTDAETGSISTSDVVTAVGTVGAVAVAPKVVETVVDTVMNRTGLYEVDAKDPHGTAKRIAETKAAKKAEAAKQATPAKAADANAVKSAEVSAAKAVTDTKPSKVAGAANIIKGGGKKAIPVIGAGFTAYEAYEILTDDEISNREKAVQGTKLAGETAGAIGGAAVGAKAGAALGLLGGPLAPATVPVGAFIGGIVGGIAGWWGGGKVAEAAAEAALEEGEDIVLASPFTSVSDAEMTATEIADMEAKVKQLDTETPEITAGDVKNIISQAADHATDAAPDAEIDLKAEREKFANSYLDARVKQEKESQRKYEEKLAAGLVGKGGTVGSVTVATQEPISPADQFDEAIKSGDIVIPEVTSSATNVMSGEGATEMQTDLLKLALTGSAATTTATSVDLAASAPESSLAAAIESGEIVLPQVSQSALNVMGSGAAAELQTSLLQLAMMDAAPEKVINTPTGSIPVKTEAASATEVHDIQEAVQAPATSPASPQFYSRDDVSVQSTSNVMPIKSVSAVPEVVQVQTAQERVERQQYDPVKPVIALETPKQDTMMPERFPTTPDKISSKGGVADGNSQRQAIADCPIAILDGGLVFIQTGYI